MTVHLCHLYLYFLQTFCVATRYVRLECSVSAYTYCRTYIYTLLAACNTVNTYNISKTAHSLFRVVHELHSN